MLVGHGKEFHLTEGSGRLQVRNHEMYFGAADGVKVKKWQEAIDGWRGINDQQ